MTENTWLELVFYQQNLSHGKIRAATVITFWQNQKNDDPFITAFDHAFKNRVMLV